MPDLTYERLEDLARSASGETLATVTGREFMVGVNRFEIFFTPLSTGRSQSDGKKAHQRFVERYNATHSDRPGDYAGVTRNASYLIALVRWGESH